MTSFIQYKGLFHASSSFSFSKSVDRTVNSIVKCQVNQNVQTNVELRTSPLTVQSKTLSMESHVFISCHRGTAQASSVGRSHLPFVDHLTRKGFSGSRWDYTWCQDQSTIAAWTLLTPYEHRVYFPTILIG